MRPRSNKIDVIPLKNAISPTTNTKDVRWDKRSDDWIASLMCKWNDLQNSWTWTAIYSSWYCSAWALFITPTNLRQAAIVFAVRRLIKPTWINDRDQFLQPNCELPDEFRSDCLMWMLFSGSNLTASADDLERNGQKRSITNHFIPYTETEVWSPDRFESDFMVQYIADLPPLWHTAPSDYPVVDSAWINHMSQFSPQAQAVYDAWRILRKAYFDHIDPHTVRDELKLNRSDVWRYQIRNALKRRNQSWDFPPVSFDEFESAYKLLSEKLRPLVYEYGFLRV